MGALSLFPTTNTGQTPPLPPRDLLSFLLPYKKAQSWREREREGEMGYAKVLLGVLLVTALAATSTAETKLKCSKAGATCTALIDYVSPNNTNIAAIQSLFQVKKFRNVLGANNFPTSTPSYRNVTAKEKIRIPFTCLCANGTGVSNRKPVYKVQKGDIMYHIAANVFSGLVSSQQIADVNRLPDASLINPGQELWIPLPCSCDEVNGAKVVHYGMVVDKGNTVEAIAEQYGTTPATLLTLNNMTDPKQLLAGQVLDIPLPACSSNVNSSSLDYPFLQLANGTYVYTAYNCVKCKCDSANNYTLQCEPSGLKPTNWTTCPAMQCEGADSLSIGNKTSSGCNQTSCVYSGFTSQAILTSLVTESICPAPSAAWKIGFQGLGWNFFLLISIQLIFLSLHLSQ
ncbi:lysM domain-containing GPI-anchored protein 2 [Juglans microcarpa x Juglans regia]|uniref:lysM domain-containing GPI-anchored protein 2 n=1 Tax=Juglans microcarpa x Juglans regia TaxID=2249226 RepID=UPI001B7DFF92|nr:lysM domain-containing GPI-anchored protein 2 [Juglans microcarpa x Juglans regia]